MSKEEKNTTENSLASILEDLILKANELGIIFKNGPATFETVHDQKIFHVLEEMTDEIFFEALSKKVEYFESKNFLKLLDKHSLFSNPEVTATLPNQ